MILFSSTFLCFGSKWGNGSLWPEFSKQQKCAACSRTVEKTVGKKKSAIVVTALPLLIFSFALHECLSKYELLLKGSGLFH